MTVPGNRGGPRDRCSPPTLIRTQIPLRANETTRGIRRLQRLRGQRAGAVAYNDLRPASIFLCVALAASMIKTLVLRAPPIQDRQQRPILVAVTDGVILLGAAI